MPLLTVRLSDEDYAALKSLAGETSMAGLIRTWIAGTMPEVPMAVWVTRDRAEAAEARVRELEDEVKRLKRELAGRPKSYEMTGDGFGVTIDPPPSKGSRVSVTHFGAPKAAPKPAGKKR